MLEKLNIYPSSLSTGGQRHFHGKEKAVYWQTCILFCDHLASLAEGDLLLSFPDVGCGLLIASGANGLGLSTKYENILWFSEHHQCFKPILGRLK